VTNNAQTFKPAWWLKNAHLQTIFASLYRQPIVVSTTRERLLTPDQDFIDIDFCGPTNRAIVILLHGLTGSSDSIYIKGLQAALLKQQICTASLNFRGCSGSPNNTALAYHSGDTRDLDFLYHYLKIQNPHTPIAAVGFSLGGNVLLKWLGEQTDKLDLFAAVAVSVPLLLDKCATRLDQGFSRLYCQRLLSELKTYVQQKHEHLVQINRHAEAEKLAQLGDITQIKSFWEYDTQVVAGLYGFRDAADYYQQSSSRRFLKHIRVPTLLIQAADDPFMSPEVLPTADELGACVQLELSKAGGHVGFVSGNNLLKPKYWLDSRIPEFLLTELP
jgi:predicted alpha/beta-fold hydrolase